MTILDRLAVLAAGTRRSPRRRPGSAAPLAPVTALALAVAVTATGPSVSALTLTLVPPTASENTFDLELLIGFFRPSDTSTGSGAIDVQLESQIVEGDAVVTGIEFTGGRIAFSDISFSIPLLLEIDGSGIAGTTESLTLPSPVSNGEFDATHHQLTVNEGVFVSTGLADQIIDISEMPFGGPGSGVGAVSLSEISRTSTSVTYDTRVTLPVAFVGRVQDTANGDPIIVDLEMSGNIVAAGEYTVALSTILAGDYNNDGVVDTADFSVWRDNVGAPAGTLPNDADGGEIGISQYQTWRANFEPSGAASGIAAPEPGVCGVLLVSAAAFVARRRGRCGHGSR